MKITPIRSHGPAVLVEYHDAAGVHQVTVPSSAVRDDEVPDDELALGIQHGLPWETLLSLRVTPEAIAAELRRRHIWTLDDLLSRAAEVKGAIMATVGNQYAQLVNAARSMEDSHE